MIFNFFKFIFKLIGKLVLTSISVVIGLFLFVGFLVSISYFYAEEDEVYIKDNSVLTINFDYYYPEKPQAEFNLLENGYISYFDLTQAIKKAAQDDRIKKLVGYSNYTSLSLPQLEEIQKLIKEFKASGKEFVLYSDTIYGMSTFLLSSLADESWLLPSGEITIFDPTLESLFYKTIMEKVGIEMESFARHEFKGANAPYIGDKFSEPVRNNLQRLLDNISAALKRDINAANSKLPMNVNHIPLLFSQEAHDLGYVDKVGYDVDFNAFHINPYNETRLRRYVKDIRKTFKTKSKHKVAILFANGVISSYRDDSFNVLSDDHYIDAIDAIKENETIKAVVLRVDSPGGGVIPSDRIWSAVNELAKKKPVVVSMGDMAASGGYMISAPATYIFANETTITGSIGVISGKLNLEKLYEKIGISTDKIVSGPNPQAYTESRPFTPKEKTLVDKQIDYVYRLFLNTVSKGRNISISDLDKIARGRVFSGKDAKELGLVDEIGGLYEAIEKAKELATPEGQSLTFALQVYPKPLDPWDKLRDEFVFITNMKTMFRKIYTEYLQFEARTKSERVEMPFRVKQ